LLWSFSDGIDDGIGGGIGDGIGPIKLIIAESEMTSLYSL